jgi:hypothetical protein
MSTRAKMISLPGIPIAVWRSATIVLFVLSTTAVFRLRQYAESSERTLRALDQARADRAFPQLGDSVASGRFSVVDSARVRPLVDVLVRQRAVAYFRSSSCAACRALEGALDSLVPLWRARTLLITLDARSDIQGLRLAKREDGRGRVTVVPSAIAVDSLGIVRASGLGGALRALYVFQASSIVSADQTRAITALLSQSFQQPGSSGDSSEEARR